VDVGVPYFDTTPNYLQETLQMNNPVISSQTGLGKLANKCDFFNLPPVVCLTKTCFMNKQ
jgi:hypothetical protein